MFYATSKSFSKKRLASNCSPWEFCRTLLLGCFESMITIVAKNTMVGIDWLWSSVDADYSTASLPFDLKKIDCLTIPASKAHDGADLLHWQPGRQQPGGQVGWLAALAEDNLVPSYLQFILFSGLGSSTKTKKWWRNEEPGKISSRNFFAA